MTSALYILWMAYGYVLFEISIRKQSVPRILSSLLIMALCFISYIGDQYL